MGAYRLRDWNAWPAKSPLDEGGVEHSSMAHMLDVAAVADELMAPCGLEAPLRHALVMLVGLHDVGKISNSFRALLRGVKPQPRDDKPQAPRHWQLSEVLFFYHDALLATLLGGDPYTRRPLYAAVAGHHGGPSDLSLGRLPLPSRPSVGVHKALQCIGDDAIAAARRCIEALGTLWPDASLDSVDDARASMLSWWLPGLCTAADWIGSNPTWFPPRAPDVSVADYWQEARSIARRVVAEAGLAGAAVKTGPLFPFSLRPVQQACATAPLHEGPMLAIVEDETGTGKTEAALILAQRFLAAGKGRGLFFALPTMATADAMFTRACASIDRLFETPTLTLAHGRAQLSVPFRDLVTESRTTADGGVSSSEWLAASTRRALLADVGIGTIDQALMAALPVRFQTLRLFGLSSKILIVDEVHEMGEPYVARLLAALLKQHRAMGGSAILLTATLPVSLREMLLKTYEDDAVIPRPMAYPAVTIAQGPSMVDFPPETRPKRGRVRVVRMDQEAEAVALLAERAAAGAACAWVRNAVDDAIAAVEALRAAGVEARLLHARFTLADRKAHEAEMMRHVGKDGTDRAGYVVVGTQVLETSLDLDFDVMVSDIAPMAALVQRAGRLWRHMEPRPASTRPDPEPVLHLLSPDPAEVHDERWLHGTLERGAWVYRVSDVWRTARVLAKHGAIDAPHGVRTLIEAVYGPEAEDVPAPLQEAEDRALGKAGAERSLAEQNLCDFSEDYRFAGRGDDDRCYPTRLGDETHTLCLARRTATGLEAWAGGTSMDAWALSEVTVAKRKLTGLPLLDQALPDQDKNADLEEVRHSWPQWRRESVTLCVVGEEGRLCDGLSYSKEKGLVFS